MLVEQTGQMPGIASVHCIGRTDDGKVMAVQRAGQTPYAPGRWSISFEEQLTTVDTTSTREDPFSAAARRGFAEEFGIPAGTVSICVIAAILETDILNRAIFALIDSDATAKELEHAAQLAITGGSEEIAAVRVIDGSPTSLRTAAQRTDLHATSALRAVLLAGLVGN